MKKPLRALVALIYLAVTVPLACAQAQAYTQASADTSTRARGEIATPLSRVVTASDYAFFLNAVGASDADNLFNEQMASDPATACIVRVGAPGRWQYEVIEGRENIPVCYVSQQDEARYCAEEKCSLATASALEMIDSGSFANGGCAFEVGSSSPLLMLAAPSSERSSSITSMTEAAGLLGLLVVPELMMRGSAADAAAARAASEHTALDASSDRLSDVSDASDLSDGSLQSCASSQSAASARTTASMGKRNQYTLGLVDFTQAALEYPTADRFIIDEGDTEAIIPSKSSFDPRNVTKNMKENKTIALAFKDVLRNEYSRELAERLIPGQRASVWDSFALGSASIFQYINKVEKRITEQNIIGSKESDLEVLKSHVERKKINVGETQEFHEKHQALFEAKSGEKTLLEKSDAAVGRVVDAIGNAHVLGLPVGPVIKTVAAGARKIEQRMEQAPLKQAKKIAVGAKKDHDQVEERWSRLKRKEDKKNGTNSAKRGVRFDDAGSAATSGTVSPDGIDLGIDTSVGGRTKPQNDHVALWEEAMRLETEAEFAEFKASKSDTPANRETYLEACRLAKLAWTSASVAREQAANKSGNERDKNLLLADVSTAEEKADDWGRALKAARARHNATHSVTSTMLASSEPPLPTVVKIQDDEARAAAKQAAARERAAEEKANQEAAAKLEDEAAKQRAADQQANQEAMARITAEAKEKLLVDQKTAADTKALQDRFAAMEAALKAADDKAAAEAKKAADRHAAQVKSNEEIRASADKKAIEDAIIFEQRLAAATAKATLDAQEALNKKAAAEASAVADAKKITDTKISAPVDDTQVAIEAPAKEDPTTKTVTTAIAAEAKKIAKQEQSSAEQAPGVEQTVSASSNVIANTEGEAETLAQIAQLESGVIDDEIKATAARKPDSKFFWRYVLQSKKNAIYELSQAIKAEALGKKEEGQGWRRAAVQRLLASDEYTKVLEALEIGTPDKLNEVRDRFLRGLGNLSAAAQQCKEVQLIKAIEAETTGHREIGSEWRKSEAASLQAKEYYTKAVEEESGVDKKESQRNQGGPSLLEAGYAAELISKFLSKAIEAKTAGKLDEATAWEEAAYESQRCPEYYLKAIEARALGKNDEAWSWDKAGNGASWASEYLAKAIDAKVAGKLEEAAAWEEAAHESQRGAEYHLKSIEARVAGKKEEARTWGYAAGVISDYLVSISKEISYGKMEKVAALEQVSRENQRRYEYKVKAIQARAAGKEQEAKWWDNASESEDRLITSLHQIIEAKAKGTLDKITTYEQNGRREQSEIEFYLAAASAAPAVAIAKAKATIQSSLTIASIYTDKASAARAEGTPVGQAEAVLWSRAAEQCQIASGYWHQALEAASTGADPAAVEQWKKAGNDAKTAANNLAAEAKASEEFVSAVAKERALDAKTAASARIDAARKAAEALEMQYSKRHTAAKESWNPWKKAEIGRRHDAWDTIRSARVQCIGHGGRLLSGLVNAAAEAAAKRTPAKQAEALLWTRSVEQYEAAFAYWADAAAIKDPAEIERVKKFALAHQNAAKCLNQVAFYTGRAADVEETAEGHAIAALWKRAAEQMQSVSNYWLQAAQDVVTAVEFTEVERCKQTFEQLQQTFASIDSAIKYATGVRKDDRSSNFNNLKNRREAERRLAFSEQDPAISVAERQERSPAIVAAWRLANIAYYTEKAATAAAVGNPIKNAEAALWTQAAKQEEADFARYSQVLEAKANGADSAEVDQWNEMITLVADKAANELNAAFTYTKKAAAAAIEDKTDESRFWRQAAGQMLAASEYHLQASQAMTQKADSTEVEKWNNAATAASKASDLLVTGAKTKTGSVQSAPFYIAKGAIAIAENKTNAAELWRQAAEQIEDASGHLYEAAQAIAAGADPAEVERLNNAAAAAEKKAKELQSKAENSWR